MTTYVDTSTLVKLLVDEDGSDQAMLIWTAAEVVTSAALIIVETRAALASAARAGRITTAEHTRGKTELSYFVDELTLVEVTEDLIERAGNVAEDEALRGYDAVHLAAALTVEAAIFTSADSALCAAAGRRGLHVANPLVGSSAT